MIVINNTRKKNIIQPLPLFFVAGEVVVLLVVFVVLSVLVVFVVLFGFYLILVVNKLTKILIIKVV
jgi:hypothetical protein